MGVLALILAFSSCAKDDDDSPAPAGTDVTINVKHVVDGADLVFNDLKYTNAAGNQYKVSRLDYYLSDFTFINSNGSEYKPKFVPFLVKASKTDISFVISKVLPGNYTGFRFMVGIPSDANVTGSLENTLDNYNMEWPIALDGGYHFMKFEGNYKDDKNIERGFTVHLGQNGMQSVNSFPTSAVTISSSPKTTIELTMNLNEWFENPHVFDFNVDGNYTMAVDSLMEKVSENGQSCFSFTVK